MSKSGDIYGSTTANGDVNEMEKVNSKFMTNKPPTHKFGDSVVQRHHNQVGYFHSIERRYVGRPRPIPTIADVGIALELASLFYYRDDGYQRIHSAQCHRQSCLLQ